MENVKRSDQGPEKTPSSNSFLSKVILSLLAVGCTPLLLFISTGNALYVRNAETLDYQLAVLYPFWIAAGTTWALGLLLCLAARMTRLRVLEFALWAYLLLGPFFLVFAQFHSRFRVALDGPWACGAVAAACLIVAGLATHKGSVRAGVRAFAWIFLFFVCLESALLLTQRQALMPGDALSSGAVSKKHVATNERRPNVYHFLFDMYETEMFEYGRTPQLDEKLRGFHYYPKNTAAYHCTSMSTPSVFQGRYFAFNTPQAQYQWNAYNTKDSFLYWLDEAGYDTYGFYIPNSLGLEAARYKPTLFDHPVNILTDNYTRRALVSEKLTPGGDSAKTFVALWTLAYLPRPLALRIADSETLDRLSKEEKAMPTEHIVLGYAALRQWMRDEADLPDHNRYTFFHVLFPHEPFVLGKDGVISNANGTTSPEEQVLGSAQILGQLSDRLKELGRFKDSMIVVHGDHGLSTGRIAIDNPVMHGFTGRPNPEARSRPLLIVKFPGDDDSVPLAVSDKETMLLDIAPTILEATKVSSDDRHDGVSLVQPDKVPQERERLYYEFPWQLPGKPVEWAVKMTEWVIRNGQYEKTRTVRLENNSTTWAPAAGTPEDTVRKVSTDSTTSASADSERFNVTEGSAQPETSEPPAPVAVPLGPELLRNGQMEGEYSHSLRAIDMTATGGTWRLAAGYGTMSAPMPVDIANAELEKTIESLVDADGERIGNVTVSGTPGKEYSIVFDGPSSEKTAPLFELETFSLTGGIASLRYARPGGVPKSWEVFTEDRSLQLYKETQDVQQGSSSLQLSRSAVVESNAFLRQTFKGARKGARYRVQVYSKLLSGEAPYVEVSGPGAGKTESGDNRIFQRLGQLQSRKGWVLTTFDFEANSDVERIRFFWGYYKVGSILLDGVSVREIMPNSSGTAKGAAAAEGETTASMEAEGELLTNGGMEGPYSRAIEVIEITANEGTWRVSYANGPASEPLAPDVPLEQFKRTLESLSVADGVPAPEVYVAGIPGKEYMIIRDGPFAEQSVPPLRLDGSALKDGTVSQRYDVQGGLPSGWSVLSEDRSLGLARETTDVHRGGSCLRLQRREVVESNALLVQPFGATKEAAKKGGHYRLQIFAKCLTGTPLTVQLSGRDASGGQTYQTLGALNPSTDWTLNTFDFQPESDLDTLLLLWRFSEMGTCLVDDISLRELAAAPSKGAASK